MSLEEDLAALPDLRARVTRLELAVMTLARMAAPLYPLNDMQGALHKVLTEKEGPQGT